MAHCIDCDEFGDKFLDTVEGPVCSDCFETYVMGPVPRGSKSMQETLSEVRGRAQANADYFHRPYYLFGDSSGNLHVERIKPLYDPCETFRCKCHLALPTHGDTLKPGRG